MRQPTIRLGYVMELVVAAAICFAVVRWARPRAYWEYSYTPARCSDWVRWVGGSLLTGLALSGSAGLIVETIRGRRPSTWGLGRWIWSIAGLFMVFCGVQESVEVVVSLARGQTSLRVIGAGPLLLRIAIHQFFGGFAWAIAAVCATAMIARTPRDPEPDAREWAGRLFASLAVALNIAEPLLRAAGQ
ncbi:MAG TPA: hypothetical protein VGH33_27070 [Isosphaeraceae bacterium]